MKGGLHPRAHPGFHGNYEVKPPKAGIALGWVTFLAFDFWCALLPIVHPIIVRCLGELDSFNQPCGNQWACLWGGYVQSGLSVVFTVETRAVVFGSWPSYSCVACFGITYRLGPTQRLSNTMIYAGGNIRVISSIVICVTQYWKACKVHGWHL